MRRSSISGFLTGLFIVAAIAGSCSYNSLMVQGASVTGSGTETVFSWYQGEQEQWLYLQSEVLRWDGDVREARMGSGTPVWKIKKDMSMAAPISEEAFAQVSEASVTWESGLQHWEDVKFTSEKGDVKVGAVKLFTVPDWVDGSGELITRVNVAKCPGQMGEILYRINYETIPKSAVLSHDFSTYVVAIEKNGTVRLYQAPENGRMLRSHLVVPGENGAYLLYGDMPGPDISAAALVTADGKITDLNAYLAARLKLKEAYEARLLGIRNGRVVVCVQGPSKTENWSDIRGTAFYELGANLKLTVAAESLRHLRVIDQNTNPFLAADGTLYTIGCDGEILFDLTHRRQLDLYQGKPSSGSYSAAGTQTVQLARSGKTATLPLYRYKGIPCFCAEDFAGLGYTQQWDAKKRETRMLYTRNWKKAGNAQLGGGATYRSDVLILFDGIAVPSYNVGGWSLVPMSALECVGVLKPSY